VSISNWYISLYDNLPPLFFTNTRKNHKISGAN